MIETSLSSAETPNYELLGAYMYVSVINLHIASPVVTSAQIPNWGRGGGARGTHSQTRGVLSRVP